MMQVESLTKEINSHSEKNVETTARVKSLEASKTIAEEASKNAKELQKENARLQSKIISLEAKTQKLQKDVEKAESKAKKAAPLPPPLSPSSSDPVATKALQKRCEDAERK